MAKHSTAKRMWAFDAPNATIDKSMIEAGSSGDWMTPFPSYLIEHSGGLVLFDTGLSPEAAGNPASVYGESAVSSRIEYSHEQRLDRQLDSIGFKPSDVEHVVLSHLHFDHTGGVALFPDALFYLGEGEMDYALNPDTHLCGLYRPEEFKAVRNYHTHTVAGGDHDLFGDGSISLLLLPGHSPGSLAMMVQLPNRTIILSGDVSHTRAAFKSACPFPLDQDSTAAVSSIKRLQSIQQESGAEVWIGHDPDDWDTFGPGSYE